MPAIRSASVAGGRRRARRGRRRGARAAGRRGARRAARPPPAGARARRGAARPASRTSAARASPAQDDVVEMRAEARHAALEVTLQPCLERRRRSAARRRSRAPPPASPSSSARSANGRARAARSPSAAPRRAPRRAPRPARSRAPRRRASRSPPPLVAARRFVDRPPPRTRTGSGARLGRRRPSDAVEVRAARGGPALHDREPIGREDERRDLRAQLLGRRGAARRSASPASLPGLQRDLELDRRGRRCHRRARPASQPPPRRIELRVRPRPRRETLRADVQRLEQVRLARSVGAGDEHEAGHELELEPLVGAEVAERDRAGRSGRFPLAGEPDRHDQVREVAGRIDRAAPGEAG